MSSRASRHADRVGRSLALAIFAAFAAFLTFASFTHASAEEEAILFRRVAVTGDQAPGAPAGAIFDEFGGIPGIGLDFPPTIDATGNVAFHAVLTGNGVTGISMIDGNALGVWKSAPASFRGTTPALVVRQDDPAPGTDPDVDFQGFPSPLGTEPPRIAGGGVAVVGGLRGPGIDLITFTNVTGIWSDASGSLELRARAGDPSPGLPAGTTFRGLGVPHVTPAGRIAFNALWRAPGDPGGQIISDQEGFWRDRTGTVEAIVLGGESAPMTEAGVVFGEGASFAVGGAFRAWDANDLSDIAFVGNLSGPGIDDLNDEGIWIEEGAGFRLFAREGDLAPGAAPGVRFGAPNGIDTFNEIIPLQMNEAGSLLFNARLSGPAVPFMRSIWTTRSGELELVMQGTQPLPEAAVGDPAPGLPFGFTFTSLSIADLNDADEIAFAGRVTFNLDFSNQTEGIWWDRPGTMSLVAHEGDQVPILDEGVVFGSLILALSFGDAGHLAFLADISGPGVGGFNNRALFAVDPLQQMHLVIREGSLFDVNGDGTDLRVVAGILPGTINALGEIPMELGFADGSSGVFVARIQVTATDATIAAVAPSSLALSAPTPNPRVGLGGSTFSFFLDRPERVRFDLYDVRGRVVAERSSELVPIAGRHSIDWNPGSLASGVYFVRMQTSSGRTATTRWTVMR